MEAEEETNQNLEQEPPPIILTIPHDTAVALAAAATHYRVLLAGLTELNPTIRQLDEVYHLIIDNPQLTPTAKVFLRNTRLVVAGLRDKPEGGSSDGPTRRSES